MKNYIYSFMNKYFLTFFISLATIIHLQAQSQTATVYLVRSLSDTDFYVPYFTYMDDFLLCRLGSGNYSVHEVKPGEHKFHAQYKGKIKSSPETDLVLNLEAGKTYYISIKIFTKAFSKGYFYCEQLSEEDGKKEVEESIRKTKCF